MTWAIPEKFISWWGVHASAVMPCLLSALAHRLPAFLRSELGKKSKDCDNWSIVLSVSKLSAISKYGTLCGYRICCLPNDVKNRCTRTGLLECMNGLSGKSDVFTTKWYDFKHCDNTKHHQELIIRSKEGNHGLLALAEIKSQRFRHPWLSTVIVEKNSCWKASGNKEDSLHES